MDESSAGPSFIEAESGEDTRSLGIHDDMAFGNERLINLSDVTTGVDCIDGDCVDFDE